MIKASIAEQEATNAVGKVFDLVLKDPFGTEQRLSALTGRVVILNFWATYCIPCKGEMPDLAAIQNEYAAVSLQVIGASTDEIKDRAKVLEFAKENKINFPIWLGATTSDMIRFGLGAALPGTVIIDRGGRVAKVISGVVNQRDLKKQIESMLLSAEREATSAQAESAKQPEVSSVPSLPL